MAERSRPAGAAPGPDERSASSVAAPADNAGLFDVLVQRGAYGNVETSYVPAAEAGQPRAGVGRADERTDQWWRDCCDRAIEAMAAKHVTFEAADLGDLGVPDPDHPNRWGPRFAAAARHGLIKSVGYGPSKRASRGGGSCRYWVGAR